MNSTSPHDWDLVVVGASFAGAACALAAAQYGLRVCVLERKDDPGARLHTTGILVKEVVEQTWLRRIPATLLQRVEQVRLYAPNLRSVCLAAPGYYFMTTDTPNVLRWLAGELRTHGVDLRLGQSFTQAHRHGDGWHVAGAGRTRYLVGAVNAPFTGPHGINPARVASGFSAAGRPIMSRTCARKPSMSGCRARAGSCRTASPTCTPVGFCAAQPM